VQEEICSELPEVGIRETIELEAEMEALAEAQQGRVPGQAVSLGENLQGLHVWPTSPHLTTTSFLVADLPATSSRTK
jgi:hypothetical protein